MVHALQQAHRMLQPHGLLISVQYLGMPYLVEVHTPEAVRKVGWLLDRNDFADERSSSNALAQVVAGGYFSVEDERDFDYRFHADNFPEYQAWISEYWTSIYMPDGLIEQLEKCLQVAGQPAKIVLATRARMTKLKVI